MKSLDLARIINQRWAQWAKSHCDSLAGAPTDEDIAELIEQHCEEKQ